MTTIIGIQGESFALICADSQISDVDDNGYATQVVTMREGTGKVQSNGRYLIGAAGDVRAINILHHAGLKEILEELVIHDCAPGFDLNNNPPRSVMGIHVKGLIDSSVKSE